ncbi:PAS domain-containing protein [Micromonospora sp. WMMD882]|uniref:PAS domain S-box protein n=1 Tax=Micromonospora sp. WMMD882 TaxID=3015151 RepID=UPI00248BD0AD|nr:PAS domain S-box protein [Micromonospora sp. WMMD882]WBB80078.1 PAS domain-containing protein [Micromonospora sp. WMMD882]
MDEPDPARPDGRRWRQIFAAGGAAGARIAGHDWSTTPLGAVTTWPQSLRTAVTICLHSRFPILLWWGPDLVMLHNDAYQPILGESKRDAMGRPGAEVWPEVWDVIGPMLDGVLAGRGATWSQDQLLLLDRNGYLEECYFTFSYSPVVGETGTPEGVFTAVTETTDRVVGDRRLRTLGDLAARLVDADTLAEVSRRAVEALAENRADLPFVRLYLDTDDGLRLAAASDGLQPAAASDTSSDDRDGDGPGGGDHRGDGPGGDDGGAWPLTAVLAEGMGRLVPLDPTAVPDRPGTALAALTPVTEPGGGTPTAVLVTGLSPRRPVDDDYRGFVELIAGHIGAALAGARAYQAERARAEALAELDAAKTAFFANVSHELRTPLTLITGPVRDALDDDAEPLRPGQRRRLELVERNGVRLRRLVDSVLDFTRIEAGRMTPDRVAVDLAKLTREIASSFGPVLEQAGLAFTVSCPPLPRPAYVDRDMWEKVVLNLLSNAYKATLRGGIRLAVADEDGRARLTVTDTGVGIPADQLPGLFERFHRVVGAAGRSVEGTGLGLALTRELVRLHDGEIDVASEPGRGATFTVRLPYGGERPAVTSRAVAPAPRRSTPRPTPIPPASLPPTPPRPAPLPPTPPRETALDRAGPGDGVRGVPDGPLVLVVDDNADLRDYVAGLLADEFRVRTAPDGLAALAVLGDDPPALVLADVMMPRLDGFGLLAAIRARPDTAHLPVVLLSARAGAEAAVEGLAAGADDYLVKPFSARELRARVRASLERAESRLRGASWADRLVKSMTDGIFVADEHGVVLQVNDAWTELLGFGQADAPYPPPYPWWPDPAEHPEEREAVDRALVHLLGEGAGAYEVPLRHRDGRRVWVSVSATSVWDPVHRRTLLLGTARDVGADRALAHRHRAAAGRTEELAAAADEATVATIGARALRQAFDGVAYLARWDGDRLVAAYAPSGPVAPDALGSQVTARLADARGDRPADPAAGIGGRIETTDAQWSYRVELSDPRAVRAEEHLLAGLLAAAVGQALRRVEAVTRQDAVVADLRGAVREANERERAWRAEAAARAARQRADRRFRTLVEASSAVVWSADATGAIREPQPSWEAYTGQRWPEYAGSGWTAMLHPADTARLLAAWRRARAAGTPLFESEARIRHAASGAHRHVAIRAAGQRDERGEVTEWIGTIYDTDDRVRAEERARRTAAISEALLDTAPVGFGWVDPDLRYRYVNPALAVMNRASVEAHLGRRPGDVLPVHGARAEELLRRTLADGPVSGVEFRDADADPAAGPRHLVASYFPIRIAHTGELVGAGFTLVDVTERTRLAQALSDQQARYERLAATDVLAVFGGEEELITEANEAFLDLLGYTRADVAQGRLTWPGLTPPGWQEADRRALTELADTGRARSYGKEYLHRDGRPVPVQIGVVALQRRPLRWLAYATDLTAERSAQAELRLFQALVERSGDFIAVATPDGRAVYVNPAGREFVGLADGEPVGRLRLLDFAAPEVRQAWRRELIPAALRDGHHRAESRLVRLDTGERRDVDHQTFTVTTGDGPESTAFLATVARDIGDRQRALRQAEALARLAGALSVAPGRAEVATAVTLIAPDVLDGARVRLATAAPGAAVATVTDRGGVGRLAVDEDDPLARAVRDNDVVVSYAPGRLVGAGPVVGICVPLRYGDGGPLGAVEACWSRPVTDDDALRNLLDTVAGLCSQALQRAELTRSARATAELAARLSVTRNSAEAIEVILTAAPVALDAVTSGLAVHEEGQRIRLHHPAGSAPGGAARHVDLAGQDPRPIAVALRTGERLILPDRAAFAARFPGVADVAGASGTVTTAVLPLLDAQRRPIAALGFGWPRARPFREGDLALLDTIADLCEQTLERVRLAAAEHNLVTRLAGRLRTSTRPAPPSLDIATRYQPAMTGLNLGGDWYDLVRLDGDRLAVVVGDVVGHRVEAAADMAQLRTMVNTLIRTGVPLGDVFPRLTDLVGAGFLGTCLAMVVDPGAGRVSVVRVGHPHPVLARRRRRPVAVQTAPSLPLGMVRQSIPVTEFPFEPGDLLVVYTDGLVERRDQPYDAGVAALRAVISAHRRRPVERIADAILTALPGSDDDRALVVIRHRDARPASAAAGRGGADRDGGQSGPDPRFPVGDRPTTV